MTIFTGRPLWMSPNRIVLAGHSAGAGNVMLIPGRIIKFLYLLLLILILLLASQYCRGMVKRIISQSGTALALWSVNLRPKKLFQRLLREFGCQRSNETEMFKCIQELLQDTDQDFYHLQLSLSIGIGNI